MIPVIARGGRSFHGAFLYYCHDPKALTADRVSWVETVNMMTDCPEKAWKVMAYTAKVAESLKWSAGHKRTGRRLEKPVFAYSLSWHPEQDPDKAEMLKAALETLIVLGLEEHEAMIIAHNDRSHAHVHILCNRVHPLTGLARNLGLSQRRLSDWARKYEREQGTVYCSRREENHRKRRRREATKYVDPVIADAWRQSSDAWEFMLLLAEQGYQVARGRKRLVVVDPYGKVIDPRRHLIGVRAQEFNQRMAAVEPSNLPSAQVVAEERVRKRVGEGLAMDQKN